MMIMMKTIRIMRKTIEEDEDNEDLQEDYEGEDDNEDMPDDEGLTS